MCRLSIIDLAGGQQPIWNEDNTCCIVYNGELYNFLDLRPQLQARGHVFRTNSDTEVVLHAYEQWGTACLQQLNGMFAFAIWDERRKTLFIARDRIGEKPLYYYYDDRRFVFASEIKAILADPDVPRKLNPVGLANFLAFGNAVAPDTIYQNIYKLLPGHFLTTESESITFQIKKYWDVGMAAASQIDRTAWSEAQFAEYILWLLDDSVKRRLIADVPVGAFLSGGVDSSSIVALMKRHAYDKVKTFSLGFNIGGAYNELLDARKVANYLETEHYELEAEHLDLVETLRSLVYHYDEPFADPAAFPVYLLSRFASQQVKVVLTGDGGDELFGGYRRYAWDQLALPYHYLPGLLKAKLVPYVINQLPRQRGLKRLARTLAIADPAVRYADWLTCFTPAMQTELLQPCLANALADHNPAASRLGYYRSLNGKTASDHLNRLMYVDLKTLLVDTYMEKTDKATMACSLEGRLPLLDYRLVEIAFQIPGKYKIKGLSTKCILKQAVGSLLPPEVLNKPKHGFAVPVDPWFRGELNNFAYEVLFDSRTRQRGYFNQAMVQRLWREHIEGRHRWEEQLWRLLNFELWHRIFLDGEMV
jgi:asparagine synthase (glutamine-hydrolysing)